MPSGFVARPVAETPGWDMVDVKAEPWAVARRWSSAPKSRLASLELP